ncbi:MAG: monovalent cation/H(+) antiporter subunit G [Sulfuritalea sp.]|jgi:multicomponent Na+:H+ antiporter subunit G|nr:monovalent cation/H(+) antiporter subunit G [Sulfuritalea sp.]
MSTVIELTSAISLLLGALFCCVGGIGLLRMPDFYTRMHAASVTETLGVALILFGLLFLAGWTLVAMKLLMVGALVFFVSPTASHALARAAITRGLKPVLADEGEAKSRP